MSSKGAKMTKKTRQKTVPVEDEVQVHTSLPPKVEGQLRCYLKLKVAQIVWLTVNPPEVTRVRVCWWGEEGQGTVFRPADGKKELRRRSCTIARYGIRSGPKQFAAYLADMGSLVLDVLTGSDPLIAGRAEINNIASLAPSKPISGHFPVYNADSEKMADLKVSVALESLMASYDSASSVPTQDANVDFYGATVPTNPLTKVAPSTANVPSSIPLRLGQIGVQSNANKLKSPAAKKATNGRQTPVGVDAQWFAPSPPLQASALPQASQPVGSYRDREPAGFYRGTEPGVVVGSRARLHSPASRNSRSPGKSSLERDTAQIRSNGHQIQDVGGQNTRTKNKMAGVYNYTNPSADLLTSLLERGNKLRNAMIVSALDTPATPGSNEGPTVIDPWNGMPALSLRGVHSAGDLIGGSDRSDHEDRTVDLVLGSDASPLRYRSLQNLRTSPQRSSLSDDLHLLSDLEDPLHDDSVLHELFYKTLSDDPSDASDAAEGEARLRPARDDRRPGRAKTRNKNAGERPLNGGGFRSRSGSNSSRGSLLDPGNQRPPSRQSASHPFPNRKAVGSPPNYSPKPPPSGRRSGQRVVRGGSLRGRKLRRGRRRGVLGVSDEEGGAYLSEGSRSEGSRVSFDPTPSDNEFGGGVRGRRGLVDGLSVQRVALLHRVHLAHVVVESLTLKQAYDLDPDLSANESGGAGGKPPKAPKSQKNASRTYFVEYQFPVVATSRDDQEPNAMATEVMRVVSKATENNVVEFGHRTMFPVLFDAESLEKWWTSALVFKVYSKSANKKLPTLLGMCCLALKSVLRAPGLLLDEAVEVKDRSQCTALAAASPAASSSDRRRQDWPLVGLLKVAVELASDSPDFITALAKTQLAELKNPRIVPIPRQQRRARSQGDELDTRDLAPNDLDAGNLDSGKFLNSLMSQEQRSAHPNIGAASHEGGGFPSAFPVEGPTLHTLLMIKEAIGVTQQGTTVVGGRPNNAPHLGLSASDGVGRDSAAARNLYVISRMFWCDDVARSNVCWGTMDPQFNLVQSAPLLLKRALLDRLRNNFLIVEVWDKSTTSTRADRLVGIVKLPLHQFYVSFRDEQVSLALLRSQYPVTSVDNDLPIVDPFTGLQHGRLRVLLAAGSWEQVSSLQQTRSGLQPGPSFGSQTGQGQGLSNTVEHVFELVIEGVSGLRLPDNMIWGEADCFIQYHFPSLTPSPGPGVNPHGSPTLKTYRSATTLCLPDPVFSDLSLHRLLLDEGIPVQREILTACAGVGGGAGGIPFELWCRFYQPSVRDEVVAKALLPLAKFCSMIASKKPGETTMQTFSLNLSSLVPTDQSTEASKLPEGGVLALTINYKANFLKKEHSMVGWSGAPMGRGLGGATVSISVGIVRACGLQAAAAMLARHDSSLRYASEVGVNCYVKVALSFLQREDECMTRVIARSFAPNFSCTLEFPCPLLWSSPGTDGLSLAEVLEQSEATFEIWHRAPASKHLELDVQRRQLGNAGDVLLGVVTLPLSQLLVRRTGISGWHPVNLLIPGFEASHTDGSIIVDEGRPVGPAATHYLDRVVGGLEMSIKFAHHGDLDRLVLAARGIGWCPSFNIDEEDWDNAEENANASLRQSVTISVDAVRFPLRSALLVGHTRIDPDSLAYVKYKLFDQSSVSSELASLTESNEYLTSSIRHIGTLSIPCSAAFAWYLREERLEIQVWVTSRGVGGSHHTGPEVVGGRNSDRLIGSAYLDLCPLADTTRRQPRVSGVYPLFKPAAANLSGACLTARLTLRHFTEGDQSDIEGGEMYQGGRRLHSSSPGRRSNSHGRVGVDEKTFPVHISVERAFHLPMVLEGGSGARPSCYVSYQTAESADLSHTQIVCDTCDPVWCHEHDTRLDRELLVRQNASLVFKVWHKPQDVEQVPDRTIDKVLGFVSVDLTPLTKGFPHLCGCYNIIDFNGVCQGQIKVSIVPTENVGITQNAGLTTGHTLISSSAFIPTTLSAPWYPDSEAGDQRGSSIQSGSLPRFAEHFDSVRRHHSRLRGAFGGQGGEGGTEGGAGGGEGGDASRSMLFTALRTNLSDLDHLVNGLRQRLEHDHRGDQDYQGGRDGTMDRIARDHGTHHYEDQRTADDTRSGPENSSGPLPLSHSSVLYTLGSTDLTTNWDPHLIGPPGGRGRPGQRSEGSLGSTGPTKDALVELMQRTLERTGSTVITVVTGAGPGRGGERSSGDVTEVTPRGSSPEGEWEGEGGSGERGGARGGSGLARDVAGISEKAERKDGKAADGKRDERHGAPMGEKTISGIDAKMRKEQIPTPGGIGKGSFPPEMSGGTPGQKTTAPSHSEMISEDWGPEDVDILGGGDRSDFAPGRDVDGKYDASLRRARCLLESIETITSSSSGGGGGVRGLPPGVDYTLQAPRDANRSRRHVETERKEGRATGWGWDDGMGGIRGVRDVDGPIRAEESMVAPGRQDGRGDFSVIREGEIRSGDESENPIKKLNENYMREDQYSREKQDGGDKISGNKGIEQRNNEARYLVDGDGRGDEAERPKENNLARGTTPHESGNAVQPSPRNRNVKTSRDGKTYIVVKPAKSRRKINEHSVVLGDAGRDGSKGAALGGGARSYGAPLDEDEDPTFSRIWSMRMSERIHSDVSDFDSNLSDSERADVTTLNDFSMTFVTPPNDLRLEGRTRGAAESSRSDVEGSGRTEDDEFFGASHDSSEGNAWDTPALRRAERNRLRENARREEALDSSARGGAPLSRRSLAEQRRREGQRHGDSTSEEEMAIAAKPPRQKTPRSGEITRFDNTAGVSENLDTNRSDVGGTYASNADKAGAKEKPFVDGKSAEDKSTGGGLVAARFPADDFNAGDYIATEKQVRVENPTNSDSNTIGQTNLLPLNNGNQSGQAVANPRAADVKSRGETSDIGPGVKTVDNGSVDPRGGGESQPGSGRTERPGSTTVPNFFLATSEMEESMRALKRLTLPEDLLPPDPEVERGKEEAARRLLASRQESAGSAGASAGGVRTLPVPTSEQAERIARIFARKFQ